MPSVKITPAKGAIIGFPVEDKSHAIRELSTRLLTVYSRKAVEKALNLWLSKGMKQPLKLGTGNDEMVLHYLD